MKKLLLWLYFRWKANWLVWSRVMNSQARRLFTRNPIQLSDIEKKILEDIDKTGIAVTSMGSIFPKGPTIQELIDYANDVGSKRATLGKKSFLENYWGTDVALDAQNPFLRIAINPRVFAITNSYLSMWVRLKHYTLNLTLPVPKNEKPQQSQRWHRDPQERRMIKMFIYLTDVTEGAGPFTYVLRSTYGKKYGKVYPQQPPRGAYPPEGAVEKAVDPKDVRIMTGSAGTVIFCDTTGLHRGGYATESERLMFTAFYSAPSYIEPKWYRNDGSFDMASLPPVARFALHET